MSEEKLYLIQNQLSQLLQGMNTMQHDVVGIKQDVVGM